MEKITIGRTISIYAGCVGRDFDAREIFRAILYKTEEDDLLAPKIIVAYQTRWNDGTDITGLCCVKASRKPSL